MAFDALPVKKGFLKELRGYSKAALGDELKGLGSKGEVHVLDEGGLAGDTSEKTQDFGALGEAAEPELGAGPESVTAEKVTVSQGAPEDDMAEGVEDPQAAAAFAGEDEVAPAVEGELDISTLSPEVIRLLLGE